jgi:hypothetical protein
MIVGCITPDGKQDYLVELIIEGLRNRGDKIIASDLSNGVKHEEVLNDNDFIKAASTFDALLVFFGKVRGNRAPKYHLLDSLNHFPKERTAYIDGSEWSCTGWDGPTQARDSLIDPSKRRGEPWIDEKMFQRVGAYFKRECYREDEKRGIVPLPFGLFDRHVRPTPFDPSKKDIDVFCSFGHTKTGLRKQLIEACQKLQKFRPDKKIVVGAGYEKSFFSDLMSRSKIVVDAWGGGDCCDRFWEAVGAGACCLYQRYQIVMPHPFADWINAVSFSNIEQFEIAVNLLLNDPHEASALIGSNGHKHAIEFHSSLARANAVMQRITK